MRRAEWRRRADDPKTALGWWWRGVIESGLRYDVLVWGFAVAVCLALFCGILWPLLPMSLYTFALVWLERKKEKPLIGLFVEPLPVPDFEGQFRAAVEYRRDGLVTGRDEMALAFVDGWLHAEGLRSTFSIRAEDIRAVSGRNDRDCALLLTDESTIVLRGLSDGAGRVAMGRRWIEAWQRQCLRPDGESTFPPARVHPQEFARWKAWMFFGIGLIPLPRVVASLLHLWPESRLMVAAAMMVGCSVGYFAAQKWGRLVDINHAAKRQEALAGGAPPLADAKGDEEKAFR